MLLALTVADIRAVGPGVWNGWKGQLLRTLFWETEVVLGGGHSAIDRKARVAAAQEGAAQGAARLVGPRIRRLCAASLSSLLDQGRSAAPGRPRQAALRDGGGGSVAGDRSSRPMPIAASPRSPSSRPTIRGCCRSSPAPARRRAATSSTRRSSPPPTASRSTRSSVSRAFELDEDEMRRADRMARTIEQALRGEIRVDELVEQAASERDARVGAFRIPPAVSIDNAMSRRYTVLEVAGPRPARPALRADRGAVEAQPQHRLGPYRHFRRKSGRFLLCHRPDRGEDHFAVAPGGDQAAFVGDFLKPAALATAPRLDFCPASADIGRDQTWGFSE